MHVFREPLCPLLKDVFGQELDCNDHKEAFTKLPITSERFSMSASSQYFSYLPSQAGLVKYIQEKICPPESTTCKKAAASLQSASYIDIDYDAISHAVVFNAFWAEAPGAETWDETISLPGNEETIEIGVLNHESNPDPEDISFAGFLTVLGEDTKPSMSPSLLSST